MAVPFPVWDEGGGCPRFPFGTDESRAPMVRPARTLRREDSAGSHVTLTGDEATAVVSLLPTGPVDALVAAPDEVKRFSPRKARSTIWRMNYFYLQDPPAARKGAKQLACCTFCCPPEPGKRYRPGDKGVFQYTGSPTNLESHLVKEHDDKVDLTHETAEGPSLPKPPA